MRFAVFVVAALLPVAAAAQSSLMIDNAPYASVTDIGPPATWVTFGGNGPSVNTKTGEVRIPKGMAPDEAAHRFWDAVAGVTGHRPEYVR